ncbi:hypothetical protein D1007_49230 [Hordeum vulgare]|uniref:Uncharacterized protein n=1 Tax=Hordeum vulgare subsp. vulgare TaxID=112509 RepID=A0A8I6XEP4_HORVV|nr:hypothetical protein D1007_49230 [Hordeum vulgare]
MKEIIRTNTFYFYPLHVISTCSAREKDRDITERERGENMARDLSSLAFAFARFIQRESHRRRFPLSQEHRAARRRHGLDVNSGPRRRSFTRNNRRRGDARHSNHPVHQAGTSAPVATNVTGPGTPPTAFSIPPMEWLVAGPSAPFLGEEDLLPWQALPPLPPYCLQHLPCLAHTGATPGLPSPMPSDEIPEHFFPPGYGPIPELPSPTPAAEELHGTPIPDLPSPTPPAAETGNYPGVPNLNLVIKVEEEEIEGHGSSSTPPPPPSSAALPLPPTPPTEARRILRQFAAAMAQNRAAVRGAWSPAALGLAGAPGESSSGRSLAAAQAAPDREEDGHRSGEPTWRGVVHQIE